MVQWAAARPLWLDEEMLAINLRDRGIADFFGPLWLGQTAPFGWMVLQKLAIGVFGAGERALRLMPMLFGAGTIATAAWIGRRSMTTAGASVLVLLCAFAQWLTFYFLELKQYSADAFFASLIPALAARSIEPAAAASGPSTSSGPPRASSRGGFSRTFWFVAAIGQWFAYAALFVTPACAAVLIASIARDRGWRAALRSNAFVLVWVASFAANYFLVLRHTAGSAFLYQVWAGAFPPISVGWFDVLRWFGGQLAGFGVKPGSAGFGLLLWICAAAGFAAGAAMRRPLAMLFATVPLSAVFLAWLRLVPFFERITLWIVPALYVGVALLVDVGIAFFVGLALRQFLRRSVAVAVLAPTVFLSADIVVRGANDAIVRARARDDNRELDDRGAIRWLLAQQEPSDVWVSTHFGVPAVWWYTRDRRARVFEALHQPEGPECRADGVVDTVGGAPRLLLYLGFRFDDVPPGFDDLLVGRLSQLGSVTAYRSFSRLSHALIIDRRVRSGAPTTLSRLAPHLVGTVPPAAGCVRLRIADIQTFVQ